MAIEEAKLLISVDGGNKLLGINSGGINYILSINGQFDNNLVNLDEYYEYFFTKNFTSIFSPEYTDGDTFINKHHEWETVVGNGFIQFDESILEPYRLEKQLFAITCPQFLKSDEYYEESLDYYLLFHSFYNTLNIVKLLNLSVENINSSNFYNTITNHFFCFYNDDFTEFVLTISEKLQKNKDMITSMRMPLWNNYYYVLYKDVLTLDGVPFDLGDGNVLDLDIVNPINNL